MVMKRTRRPRKFTRRVKRKTAVPRPMKYSRTSVVSVKRTFWSELWLPNATTTNGFWRYYAPSISAMPSLAEFQAVFDQYKINGVTLTFRPKFDSYAGNDNTSASTNRSSTQVHYIVDKTSNITPTGTYSSTTCNSFLENGGVKSRTGLRPVNIFYTPMIANTQQGVNDASRTKPRWLSLANASGILQNGVHVFMQDSNFANNQTQAFDVFITYYMQFRGLR